MIPRGVSALENGASDALDRVAIPDRTGHDRSTTIVEPWPRFHEQR